LGPVTPWQLAGNELLELEGELAFYGILAEASVATVGITGVAEGVSFSAVGSFLQNMFLRPHSKTVAVAAGSYVAGVFASFFTHQPMTLPASAAGGATATGTGTVATELYKARLIPKWLYKWGRTGGYIGTAVTLGFGLGYGSGKCWQWEWEWLNGKNGKR
jgi:hypothetical protein